MRTLEPTREPVKMSAAPNQRRATLFVCLALVASIAAVYWPLATSGFIHCDDPDYVYQNPQVRAGISWSGVVWAFTSDHAGNWHPITWLSHMLDCQLFGVRPGAHHLVNVFFHALNAVLLFLLLQRLTGALWRSALVAALFGLHPLHVESVAWISERKDVLSAFFFLLTIWAYATYAKSRSRRDAGSAPGRSLRWYVLALLLFALGLMSKPMLVTLPCVLLLLDFWPLGRLRVSGWGQTTQPARKSRDKNPAPRAGAEPENASAAPGWQFLLMEKLPFLLLSLVSSVVTFIAQGRAGAVMSAQVVPPDLRVENALVSYVLYLGKMALPINLAFSYPYPNAIPIEHAALALLLLLGISFVAITYAQRLPWLIMGWAWYLGMLVPVIGLVQVGNQAMADRYAYLPLIGIFIALVWSGGEVVSRWRRLGGAILTCAGAALGLCAVLTARQVRWWHDSETFFRHTLAITPNNALAHLNLGTALAQEGKLKEAGDHFAEALRLAPTYAEAESNLGFTLAARGDYAKAVPLYREALARKPFLRGTHFLLGSALSAEGRPAEAIPEYEAELSLQPDNDAALNDLAWLRATAAQPDLRNGQEAVALAERACRLTHFKEAQYIGTLAAAYAEAGRFRDAATAAERAIQVAAASGEKPLIERNKQLLELYRAGKAYHESPPPARP